MLAIRKADERGSFDYVWLKTSHSFSFGEYYDPRFMGFSVLRVINEDRVLPDQGFGAHSHKDMEILSYVLSGSMMHRDSMGYEKVLSKGEFQIMSAGSGIRHSEFNASHTEELHFYQIWIQANQLGLKPRYEQKAFDSNPSLILSPDGKEGSFKIYQDMSLWRYQNLQEEIFEIEKGRRLYLQVIRGELEVLSSKSRVALKVSDGLMVEQEQSIRLLASGSLGQELEVLLFDLP